MISLIREANTVQTASKFIKLVSCFSTAGNTTDVEEFRVLEIHPKKKSNVKTAKAKGLSLRQPSKAEIMPTDQNWQAVWPTARTFHPDVVPLPLRQGYQHNKGIHPWKIGNAELMKIPNFLHLTPPAIKAHCEALKKFCTEWPQSLTSDKEIEEHFPVEIISSDYCYSSPTIREPLARVVSLRVKVSSLDLDAHAKDKFLRLVGDRYNPETDIVTIVADRCPVRKQNLDYVHYLLTALFHVSWRVEPWEAEKAEVDMEYYDWDNNKSRQSLLARHYWPESPNDLSYEHIQHAGEYKTAVTDLINNGEDNFSINKYKQAVRNVLNLKCVADME